MASKFLDTAQRGASNGAIDAPLAALVGLSLAFVAFVMPVDLLSRLVELSQLPSILSAAEPPLGTKARAALSFVAGGGGFAAVFLLLRWLGRAPPRPRAADDEPEYPKLRRSDFHPDSPSRRPILAGRDFGEPEATSEPASGPFWRPDDFPAEPDEEEPTVDALEDELELGGPGTEIFEPEPSFDEPAEVPFSLPSVAPVAAAPATDPAPAVARAEPGEDSISDLMARLERGLARRLQQQAVASAAAPVNEPPVSDVSNDRDDRLRSAIENLQKMASRAG